MATRLIVCFDGTWNRPDPVTGFETNVCRFYESVPSGTLPNGDNQQKWYEPGVGGETRHPARDGGGFQGRSWDAPTALLPSARNVFFTSLISYLWRFPLRWLRQGGPGLGAAGLRVTRRPRSQ